jgi:hypothetical protein
MQARIRKVVRQLGYREELEYRVPKNCDYNNAVQSLTDGSQVPDKKVNEDARRWVEPTYEIGDRITMAGRLPTEGVILDKAEFAGKVLLYMVGRANGGIPTGSFIFTTVNVRDINIEIPAWLPEGCLRPFNVRSDF